MTLFLSIDGYDLVQLTFKWRGNKWEFRDWVKVLEFEENKEEEKSPAEQIEEMKKQRDKDMALMSELLFGSR